MRYHIKQRSFVCYSYNNTREIKMLKIKAKNKANES